MQRTEGQFNFRFKYGSLVQRHGFTQVPNILIRERKMLGLTQSELTLAIYLLSYEYDGIESWPSLAEMERKSGMSSATVHKAKRGLATKGYLKMSGRGVRMTSRYSLAGLRKKLRDIGYVITRSDLARRKISEEEYSKLMDADAVEKHLFR